MHGTGSVASSVELISNAVFVTGVNVRDASFIFRPGTYDHRAMPSLLHEAAHWETFAAPVGMALAQSFLNGWHAKKLHDHFRGYEGGRGGQPDGFYPDYEATLDYTRFAMASELMRPLAEGIALFVEFDHLPYDSPVTCTVTKLAGLMFGNWERSDIVARATLGQIAHSNLSGIRRSAMMIARKENLLCQPFQARSGGYLPGYVLIKAMRNYLISVRGLTKLIDGDLFVWLLKVVLFGDLELARLILDREEDFFPSPEDDGSSNHRDVINKIGMRIVKLIEFLLHDMDAAFVDRVEKVVGSGAHWSWADLQIGEHAAALPVLQQALNEPVGGPNLSECRDRVDLLAKNRRLLCLGSVDVHIRVNEHRRCIIHAEPSMKMEDVVMAVPAMEDAIEGSGPGTLEVYFADEFVSRDIICVAHLEGAVVACFTASDESDFDPAEFARMRPSFAEASALAAEMQAELSAFASSDFLCSHYLNQMEEASERLYHELCGPLFAQFLKGDLVRITAAASLLDLIPQSHLDTFSTYCELSLRHGGVLILDQHRMTIEEVAGMPTDRFLEQLEALRAETGIPFATIRGGLMYCNF